MINLLSFPAGFSLGKRAGTERTSTAEVFGFFFEVRKPVGGIFARGEELGGYVRMPELHIPLQNSKKKEVGADALCEKGFFGSNEVF